MYESYIDKEMVAIDWASCKIPVLMAQAIDEFVKTDLAKKNGVFSRSDFIIRLVAGWFSRYEKDFGIFVPRDVIRMGKHESMKPFD